MSSIGPSNARLKSRQKDGNFIRTVEKSMASNEDSTRSPVPLPFKKRRLFGSHHASDGSDAGDNGGNDGSHGWEVPFAPDPRLSAFDLSPRHALAMSGYSWAAAAKALAEDIRFGRLTHCVWWYDKDDELMPLLRLASDTGVHSFMVGDGICCRLHEFLSDPSNYSEHGFLMAAGASWAGYGNYPYVHAPGGHVPELQERRTVRVQGLAFVNKLLKEVPVLAHLVSAVRAALGVRQPGVGRPQLPAGKRIVAMHFLAQDSTRQAVFSWHDDAEDIGRAGRKPPKHMTTVIVNLSQEFSGMRVWRCCPTVYDRRGSAVAFPGAALHESLPRLTIPEGVVIRKVALFFN